MPYTKWSFEMVLVYVLMRQLTIEDSPPRFWFAGDEPLPHSMRVVFDIQHLQSLIVFFSDMQVNIVIET